MSVREIRAKSVLRKHKKIDSWFVSHYGMNLYRGCSHDCVYCDGRSESYYVEGVFGKDIAVKVNAPEILERELDPERRRIPLKKSFMMVGGGVGDGYQPVERDYHLTRKVLQLIEKFDFPVHILTKSTMVKRDIDILKRINEKKKVIISFSFSSVDDHLCSIFEPNVPGPGERMEALAFFKKNGIACGLFLLPVIPFISDDSKLMEQVIKKGKEAGVDFIIFGGLTLKSGKQKSYFLKVLENKFPELSTKYTTLYRENRWGQASGDYYDHLNIRFFKLAKKYRVPVRIPFAFYNDILSENDRVIVILEHMDYLLKIRGDASSYAYAAYSLSKLKEPLSILKSEWKKVSGVGTFTEGIIREILQTGTSAYYERLMGL